jgi:hypothetical protein
MSIFLSWWWMRLELSPLWRRITLRRHQGELRALRAARLLPPMAIFPIGLTIGGWYLLLGGVPSLVLFLLQQLSYTLSPVLGLVIFVVNAMIAIVALCLIAPWVFRWYFIAASMMLGRSAMADRKEAELIASIAAAKPPG